MLVQKFFLEFLILMEEHTETDNGSVDQQTTGYGHDHSFDLDEVGMRQNDGKGYTTSTSAHHL